ncbi:MAG TPA: FCD domain-containing protein [Beijerinckiaceae bacterium]|jgi:DNA-binding FadR family transcriptional regulator
MNGADTALLQLRNMLSEIDLSVDSRLPPERDLAQQLGVQRPALRKALAVLEAEGQIWRHVGRGTFVGSRPAVPPGDVSAIARMTNPGEVMRTRILLEPEVAALAALNATPASIAEMRGCVQKSRTAPTWRQYEAWDNRLHRAIAEATQNYLLLALLDTLTAVRRTVTWGRLRTNKDRPKPDHHSFADHEQIVAAIADRDRTRAREAMRRHLEHVERNLLRPQAE